MRVAKKLLKLLGHLPKHLALPTVSFDRKYGSVMILNCSIDNTGVGRYGFDNAHYFLRSHSMHKQLDIVALEQSWYISQI